jgi:(1->4)-alpha-D-glucan 1-alpha-D-glucosylmutase
LYQTLVGVWPWEPMTGGEFEKFQERIVDYMRKATMEAKVHTSWVNPNEEYEMAVRNFILRIMDSRKKNRFIEDLKTFQRRTAFFGQWNALSQVLLKLASPGVPDFYQGTELWDFSLVDPDNRRPVDYGKRQALLRSLEEKVQAAGGNLVPLAQELLEQVQDGRIKLFLIYRTLNFRRSHSALFTQGTYIPLKAIGPKKDHICAFARLWKEETIVTVAPRLVVGLTGGVERPPLGEEIWKDTFLLLPPEIPSVVFKDLYTGEEIQVEKHQGGWSLQLASIFQHFPVALLHRERL